MPLRRARQAIDSAVKLIETSYGALHQAEHAPVGPRLVRASRQLLFLNRWMRRAQEKLSCATRRLRETTDCLALEPERIGDAPSRMIRETERLIDASMRLNLLSYEAGELVARMRAALEATAASAGSSGEPAAEASPRIHVPKPNRRRNFLLRRRCRRVSDRLRSLGRRRRSPLTVADAPRRISRGRAPPPSPVSTCQL